MKYKAIFFDLDGTLLDTARDVTKAINKVMKKYHLKRKTVKKVKSYFNYGAKHTLSLCVEDKIKGDQFELLFKNYLIEYFKNSTFLTKKYNGIDEVINYALKNNIVLVVVTNKPHNIATKVINYYFPNKFKAVYGQIDARKNKPDKESISIPLKELNLKENEVLYIGDSMVDLNTAENSSLDYLICTYGYTNWSKKENIKGKFIDSAIEIISYLH